MKRLISLLLALTVCFALVLCVGASSRGRLVDDAGLLSSSEKAQIIARLDSIADEYDFDVVIITTTYDAYWDILDYAEDCYLSGGYRDDGIILLRQAGERPEWGYVTFGEGNDIFDGGALDRLDEAFLTDLKNGSYAEAFIAFADTCEEILQEDSAFPVGTLLLSIAIGIVLALMIPMSVLKGQLKSVRMQTAASSYVRQGSMVLTQDHDYYLYRNVTRTAKPKNTSSGGARTTSGGNRGRSGRG